MLVSTAPQRAMFESIRLRRPTSIRAPRWSPPVPQVWLTYDELGEMFGLNAATARSEVIANGWPRRRSSDSLTRVKLPPAAAHEYILGYVASANPRAGAARDASP